MHRLEVAPDPECFSYLSYRVTSDFYDDPQFLCLLKHQFQRDGYVRLPRFLRASPLQAIRRELDRLYSIRWRRDFVMPEFGSPRRLSVIGGSTFLEKSVFLTMLYRNRGMRAVVAEITQKRIYSVSHKEEFMVANFLDQPGDTHGWHVDDPSFALVLVLEAPPRSEGGCMEFVSGRADGDASEGDRRATRKSWLKHGGAGARSEHHAPGECYLLHARQNLHRVTPLKSGVRKALNMAYADRPDVTYGQTATSLYGAPNRD